MKLLKKLRKIMVKYDSKTGETTTTLFKGKVSLGHKMTVTSVIKAVGYRWSHVKKVKSQKRQESNA